MYVKCSFSLRMRLSKSFSKQFEILTLNLCGAQFLGCIANNSYNTLVQALEPDQYHIFLIFPVKLILSLI